MRNGPRTLVQKMVAEAFGGKGPMPGRLPLLAGGLVSRMVVPRRLEALCRTLSPTDGPGAFFEEILLAMGIKVSVTKGDLGHIPEKGPCIVVANHPFGGIDGIVLGSLLLSVRSDAKVMANYLLGRIPELREAFLPVDPFSGRNGSALNLFSLRATLRLLKEGGLLAIFPAGEVSHVHLRERGLTDPQWTPMLSRLVRATGAPVLPAFFPGANSALFQGLGLLHPRLRTMMLPREMLKKKNRTVEVRLGRLIPFERLRGLADQDMMGYLRFRTYLLGVSPHRRILNLPFRGSWSRPLNRPLAPKSPSMPMEDDLASLPGDRRLLSSGPFEVFLARSREIPNLLREVGRLRELTFRQAMEGTGKAIDLDAFDETYLHLVLWHRENREVAGAYRLGPTDLCLEKDPRTGLYIQTLFSLDPEFFERTGPALELGRSFVCPSYQKSYQALLLLWKGIGRFVLDNPRYRVLFGPVSIADAYHPFSRHLIVSFLKHSCEDPSLSRLVRPRHPVLLKGRVRNASLRQAMLLPDPQSLSELLAEIEEDEKGIPILLKHYLRLGGRCLGFSVDPSFSRVVDALILVDLHRSDRRILERFLGKEGVRLFLGEGRAAWNQNL